MPQQPDLPKHDIKRQIRDLNEAMSQEKRQLALLIGAGCPVSIRVPRNGEEGTDPLIPDVAGLTTRVSTHLSGNDNFGVLTAQFAEDGHGTPNIEHLLTQVRNLKRVVGSSKARGLGRTELAELEAEMCRKIAAETSKFLPTNDTPYHRLARWIHRIRRSCPITLFTTNYDVLVEQALEEEEVPFFDGFSGSRRPFFDIRAIEEDALPNRWTRLWKLHGSVNWRIADGPRKAVFRAAIEDGAAGELLIHPSELKYDQSRRMPYLAMFDRLRAFLRQPGAVLVTCGYSFADEHLNETIVEGLAANPGAAAFGLLFKKLHDEAGAAALIPNVPRNLSLLAADRAVIRRVAAAWWDPDAQPDGPTADAGGAPHGGCTFDLGDFARFGAFLSSLGGESIAGPGAP